MFFPQLDGVEGPDSVDADKQERVGPPRSESPALCTLDLLHHVLNECLGEKENGLFHGPGFQIYGAALNFNWLRVKTVNSNRLFHKTNPSSLFLKTLKASFFTHS